MAFMQRILQIFGLFACTQLQAGGNPEDIQALRDLLQPITSLSAKFTQQINDPEGFTLETSEGLFDVAQPAKMYWHVTAPMVQQIISDGSKLWVFDPDLEQVIIQPFDRDIATTPAVLFSGELDQLDRAFYVRKESSGLFTLTPQRAGSLFKQIQITFVSQQPVSIVLTDNLDQITVIKMTELQINPAISADRFIFEIPSDIDVIDNTQSSVTNNAN
jgi:outer membrane lipoprotein carrier protein